MYFLYIWENKRLGGQVQHLQYLEKITAERKVLSKRVGKREQSKQNWLKGQMLNQEPGGGNEGDLARETAGQDGVKIFLSYKM